MQQQNTPNPTYAPLTPPAEPTPTESSPTEPGRRSGHHWLMWLMCVPMLLLVGALIATGRLGAGGLLYALGCLLMMGVMMAWMNHGNNHEHKP